MRFFQKLNPKATWHSVLRRALTTGFVGMLFGLAAMAFDERPRSDAWVIGFVLWITLCSIVGAVFEWQVPNERHESTDTAPSNRKPGDPPKAVGKCESA